MRTLLIEDDPLIGEAVCQALRNACYAVDWVTDGIQAVNAACAEPYAALLLDLGLPGQDGLAVLRELRARGSAVPVLVLTARSAIEERIAGLDHGADDYLVKPFHVDELLARLRALTRRQGQDLPPVLRNGALSLDPARHEVWYEGRPCQLSAREFALLREFLLRPGVILSRRDLEARLYGWDEAVESNAIEFLIHGVRKKLDAGVIKNVRGVGWLVPKAQ